MVTQIESVREYFMPRTTVEALQLLQSGRGRRLLIGGGTSFTFSAPRNVEGMIDLSRAGLAYVKQGAAGIRIGAATPIANLAKNPLFADYYGGIVRETALNIATTPLRNLITVGGNVMRVF